MTRDRQVVQCPKCGTRLRLKSAAETPSRFKVRCSACKEPFVVRRKETDRGTQPLIVTPSSVSAVAKRTVATTPDSGSVGSSRSAASRPRSDTESQLTTNLGGGRKTFEVGEVVSGRYEIVRFIDQGGMGEVYEAKDSALGQSVALKTIRPTVAADAEALARFKREIHVARQVTHRNVCRIYDLGTHHSTSPIAALYPGGEILFVTMELLKGETLAQRLSRTGSIEAPVALLLAKQMAEALDAAHAAGVVHRDFKSANVFLESKGSEGSSTESGVLRAASQLRVVVTDFGLARAEEGEGLGGSLTIAGSVLGSPAYMSPEQVEGNKVTGAADLYALGVVLYEMCTGQVPFRGDTPLATAVKRLTENPPSPREIKPGLDPHWERSVLRCLERAPENRFQSGAEVIEALTGKDLVRKAREERVPINARRIITLTLAVVLIAAALAINWRVWKGGILDEPEINYLQPPAVARPAVAVMGFRNVTGNEEHGWLSTGLAEMLSSELSTGGAVRLIPGENVSRASRELDLTLGDTFADETLKALRLNLGSDFVVSGGYTLMGEAGSGQLRVDLRLQDTVAKDNSTALAVSGSADQIFDLVSEAGEQLREALGSSIPDESSDQSYRAANQESVRLFALGVAELNAQRAAEALSLLEAASEVDARNPRIRAAMAKALHELGYAARAEEEAKLALELSTPLGPEERLSIEGLFRRLSGDWVAAARVYDQLWRANPDDLELGLNLAEALIASGDAEQSLKVARVLEQLPSAAAGDVRILFVKARAAGAKGEFRRQAQEAARAAQLSSERGERLRRAQALLIEGWARRNLGEVQQAQGVTTEAEGLFQQLGDLPGVARARIQRGSLLYDSGDLEGARRVFEQGVATYRELGDKGGLSQALNNLAVVYKRQGEMNEAHTMYEESLRLSTETTNRVGIANSEVNLGGIALRRGELSAAQQRFERALGRSRELGDRSQEAYCLYYLAVTQRRKGDLATALALQEEALELRRSIGARVAVGVSLLDLGNIALQGGEPAAAAEHYEGAAAIAEETENLSLGAYAQQGLGDVRYEENAMDRARTALEAALARRLELGEVGTEAENRIALARLEVQTGNFEAAAEQARLAASAADKLGATDLRALSNAYLGWAQVYLGNQAEAQRLAAVARQRAEESEDLWIKLEILICTARIAAASDRVENAREVLQTVAREATLAELPGLRLEGLLLDSRLLVSLGQSRAAQEGLVEVIDEGERRGLLRLAAKARDASARSGSVN